MVIARDQIAPIEVFEHHPVKPLVRGIQQWPKLGEAEARRAGGGNAKDGIDLAAKAQTLQVQKPRRTLEVGQMGGIGLAQLLEPAARDDLKPQHVHELRIVALQDAKEVDDLAVAVVHHLKARLPRPAQKHAAHADEGLNIGAVGDAIDARDQGLGELALAAQPAGDGCGGAHGCHCVHGGFQNMSRPAHGRESGDVSGVVRRRGLLSKLGPRGVWCW